MASFYYLNAVIFLVCCSTTTLAEEISTSQPRNNTFNGTITSVVCKPHISKSEIEEVLRLQYNSTTNTVKIKVSVVSENETRYLPEMTWLWASEIGRTIISLVRRAKDTIFASPIFTSILEIGTEEVDIQITEKTDACLPPGEEGSDRIFDFLLHQLSHSKDTPVYKLCRVHQDESLYATYNCCQITEETNGARSVRAARVRAAMVRAAIIRAAGVRAAESFFAPIFTLLVYFLKNWKFSVEAKYLQLKTLIIKVCKKKTPPTEDENISANSITNINAKNNNESTMFGRVCDILCPCIRDTSKDPHTWRSLKNLCSCCTKSTLAYKKYSLCENIEIETIHPNEPSTSGNGDNADSELANINESGKEDDKLVIEFDELNGEAKISKELYEKVSEIILPMDHLLFYFFRRVIFVGLYAFVMFTVMILARESGISGSVQVMSAIAGGLIPFLFDTSLDDSSLSEKMSRIMATKEKLEHILKVKKRENNRIFVELININDGEIIEDPVGVDS
ncbi:Hypothetical predicted protein [Paramuricea clavata]|uniref:Uncharacterized protein n=1 Tax=Paramuricea clavata TaxID=317549 RepID=A0A6S7I0U3_PARCT|nr:Hypothetical predicted protein [Paramuricea clavata]